MVTFLLPRSNTLDTTEYPNHPGVALNEKEPLRIMFHRTSSKSPERVRHRTDPDEKSPKGKTSNRNSWFRSITSPFVSGGTSPRSGSSPAPSPFDTPTHVRRRARSLVDPRKVFAPQDLNVDPRLPDHMRRPELQLRRIQGRNPPSSKLLPNRSSSLERAQKHALWWSA